MIDLIGAAIVALNKDNPRCVLLGKRKKEEGFGLWCLAGGKVDDGETPDEAVRREALEEINLVLHKPIEIYFKWNQDDPNRKYLMLYYYELVDPTHIYIRAEHEFSELAWYDVRGLPQAMWEADRMAVKRAYQHMLDAN